MDDAQTREIYSLLKGLPKAELIPAVKEAMQGRTKAEKQEIAAGATEAANGMGGPNPETRDKLWKIVVTAFAIVLVGGFIALAIGLFVPNPKEGESLVNPELILTTFTSVVGFLAGLFTPSPVGKATNGGSE